MRKDGGMLASMIKGALTARRRQVNCTQAAFVSRMSIYSFALLVFLLMIVQVAAQEDTIPKKAGIEAVQEDSIPEKSDIETIQKDSVPQKTGIEEAQADSLPEKAGTEAAQIDSVKEKTATEAAQVDSISKETDTEVAQKDSVKEKTATETAQKDTVKKIADTEKSELVNFALKNRKVRPYGWGEYRVGGRCLCCDNKNDGDCIVVHTIERTNRLRIKQLLDGKIEGDTSNSKTYFGNVMKRDHPEPVTTLMVDISLGKEYEIRKVIVHSIIDKEKRTNSLSNCELGYYDQFNRLQWTGKVKSKKFDEPIEFNMKNPALTKKIMLRIKGGKNIITEVAIFSKQKTE
jgi:hypothetical protein